MANRFPLIVDASTQQVKELPSGDNLDLTGSGILNSAATITLPTATGTLATLAGTETLTNKTINLANNTLQATSAQIAAAVTDETGSGALVFATSPAFGGTPTAPTAAAGTNTTQIATTAHVFAERSNTATLTNKTLTSPVIGTIVNTGTLTLPTSTDTLVGRATTDTLTNKTLTSPTINGAAISGTISGNATLSGTLTLSATTALKIPTGTTAQRPGSPTTGQIRYNSSIISFEGYNGTAWSSLGGVKSVDGLTFIQAETSSGASNGELDFYAEDAAGTGTVRLGGWNRTRLEVINQVVAPQGVQSPVALMSNNITTSFSIPEGYNAISAGPIAVASGIAVTVPSGSVWTIV